MALIRAMITIPAEVIRFATFGILMGVPIYKTVTIQGRLKEHRRDGGRREGPAHWTQAFDVYKPETYTPEGQRLLRRLQTWRKIQFGDTVLALLVFFVWEVIDPVLR